MLRISSTFLFAVVVVLLSVSLTAHSQSQFLLTHHTRDAVVKGQAQFLGRLPAAQTMRFDVVLALRHPAELDSFLEQLYDPTSPSYRRFVTVKEFTERFGPSREDYNALIQFAGASGFRVTGGSRDAMDVQLEGTVAAIEKAFHVRMGVYQHPTEPRTFYAPDREPTVHLPFQLWHITGLDNYSIPRPLLMHRNFKTQPQAQTGSCPGQSFCGSDMRAAYYEGTDLTGAGQYIGLLEFAGFDIADVNTYYQNAGQTRTFTVAGISTDGSPIDCVYPSCDDAEQTIDITQAGGMAPGVSTVYLYVGTSNTTLLSAMASDTPLTLNLSSSWVWGPADPKADDPYFKKMAAQGQSFFQASGDSGGFEGSALWPSNAAYVISVGGTDLTTTGAAGAWASETAWTNGGGGWGTNVPIPSWELPAATVCANEAGGCSETYRDFPDVAANADYTFYVCADQSGCTENEVGGTSFAAPMWAGYIALANQQAAAAGNAPVASLIQSFFRSIWGTVTPISTTSRAAVTAFRVYPVSICAPGGAVRTGPA